MPKYLPNNDVKKNHLYVDSKGFEVIYLGQAEQQDICWSYPLSYIYIKKDRLDKYPNTMPLGEILKDLSEKGVRHYCFSEKPRKVLKEIGIDNRDEIHGSVGIFTFVD